MQIQWIRYFLKSPDQINDLDEKKFLTTIK